MVASLAAEQSFVWAFCWSRAAESECEAECNEEYEHDDDVQDVDCAGFAADARHRDTSIFSETGISTLIVFDILIPSKLPTEIRVGIL